MLSLLLVVAIAAIRLHDLFAVVMLSSIYSLLSAVLFMNLDAVDVAFTEAAVGAGISGILLLASLRLVGSQEKAPSGVRPLPFIVVLITGSALIYGLSDAPNLGDPMAPAQQHVGKLYIEQSEQATGVPNMVTAVLASYRGYDTLGETVVVLTAGLTVFLLLGQGRAQPLVDHGSPHDRSVMRYVVRALLPFPMLFALYVQFHGDFGAGGGFQAGVIFAAGLVLFDLVFGAAALRQVLTPDWLARLGAAGVLIYGGVGLYSLLSNKHYLDYSALAADPVAGQHLGILLVELGVGLCVFAMITLIYMAFAGREEPRT